MAGNEHLRIYLNDHLAGTTVGLELARRLAGHTEGELGRFTEELSEEIKQDRQTLIEVMDRLGLQRNPGKIAASWLGEKLGRLKMNGSVLRRSPLSLLIELEALSLGVEGKRSLWISLMEAADGVGDLGVDLKSLAKRAEKQRSGLERFRRQVAEQVLG